MTDKKEIIENARITGTMLGIEDHGIMTCQVALEFDGSACCFGGYCLDEWSEAHKKRIGLTSSIGAIREMLEALELEKWEELKGTYVRVKHCGWGSKVHSIGHLMKDRWFSFEEYFSRHKEVENG